jgi:hypothetical protein
MVVAAAVRARFFEKPAASAATATLAANRLRSTVKSTLGSVSSKSFISKRILSSWGGEGAKVHQMAVAAGLNDNPWSWLMSQVLPHHSCSTAQKGEWARQHSLIANRYQLRNAGTVARRQDRHRVAISGSVQVSMMFTGRPPPQPNAMIVTLGERAGRPGRELAGQMLCHPILIVEALKAPRKQRSSLAPRSARAA